MRVLGLGPRPHCKGSRDRATMATVRKKRSADWLGIGDALRFVPGIETKRASSGSTERKTHLPRDAVVSITRLDTDRVIWG